MRKDTALLVNFENLSYNFQELNKLAPHNEVLFMIKANAYGSGLTETYRYAKEVNRISNFGVASLGEAIKIRETYPKDKTSIYVFSDLNLDNHEFIKLYDELDIIPVLSDMESLKIYIEKLKSRPLVIKLNTGMNRLGFAKSEVDELISIVAKNNLNIFHLMTHFSSSYFDVDRVQATKKQYELFCDIKKSFLSSGVSIQNTSCANSGAIEQEFSLNENFIRPGLMLYGPYSVGGIKNEPIRWHGKNINSLETRIIKKTFFKKGTPIGYGGTVVDGDYQVLLLPIGYGDGFLTYYANAKFKLESQEVKVLGRVNMDMVALGVKGSSTGFKLNQKVKIWDFEQASLMQFSRSVKTIPYQVMCAISTRVPRIYL